MNNITNVKEEDKKEIEERRKIRRYKKGGVESKDKQKKRQCVLEKHQSVLIVSVQIG